MRRYEGAAGKRIFRSRRKDLKEQNEGFRGAEEGGVEFFVI